MSKHPGAPQGAPTDLSGRGIATAKPKEIKLQDSKSAFAGLSEMSHGALDTYHTGFEDLKASRPTTTPMSFDDLKASEAIGQIKSGDVVPEPLPEPTYDAHKEVIDNPALFQMAVGNAQMEGAEYIEVSERLFNYLKKNTKTKYLTYGEPGIKVYCVGTRELIEAEESMSAEAYHNYLGTKREKQNGPASK